MRHVSNSFNIAAIVFLFPTRHRTNVAFEALLLSMLILLLLEMELFAGGKASPEIWEVFVIGLSDRSTRSTGSSSFSLPGLLSYFSSS